jgi:hypothetical protein
MSNSRDPNDYMNMPSTPEEEEAWLLLAAREAFEIKERESKKPKTSSLGQPLLSPIDTPDSSD